MVREFRVKRSEKIVDAGCYSFLTPLHSSLRFRGEPHEEFLEPIALGAHRPMVREFREE
jgi:hypothetical protein